MTKENPCPPGWGLDGKKITRPRKNSAITETLYIQTLDNTSGTFLELPASLEGLVLFLCVPGLFHITAKIKIMRYF